MIRCRNIACAAAIAAAMLVTCGRRAGPVRIAVTPPVAETGIAPYLADLFVHQTGAKADLRTVDPAQIDKLAHEGETDVLLVNDPAAARSLEQEGLVSLRSTFAFDDFVILGPRRDPAGVHAATTAADAFRAIATHGRTFCAPVDVAPLRRRELELWAAAKVDPKNTDPRYRECKGDGIAVLREASRRDAYTISDRATVENAKRDNHLSTLMHNTPMLHNDFTVVLLTRKHLNPNAEWFVQWIMSFRGHESIDAYRENGQRRMYVSE